MKGLISPVLERVCSILGVVQLITDPESVRPRPLDLPHDDGEQDEFVGVFARQCPMTR